MKGKVKTSDMVSERSLGSTRPENQTLFESADIDSRKQRIIYTVGDFYRNERPKI